MKFNQKFIFTVFSLLLAADVANAQTQLAPSSDTLVQQQNEIERLKQDKEIRDRVQSEVDRAFNHNITLLNALILILILLPIASFISIWLLRRSIIDQIASDAQEQLQIITKDIQKEINQQVEASQQQIELTSNENLHQIQTAIADMQNLLEELKREKNFFEQELVSLKNGYVSQTPIIYDMPTEDKVEIENLESALSTEDLTANEYLDRGNDFLAQGRYEEANSAYNEAVKIERDLPEARYQNARSYAMRRSINLAIENLQWAIDINPMYKEIAKNDPAFNNIRGEEQFKKLLE